MKKFISTILCLAVLVLSPILGYVVSTDSEALIAGEITTEDLILWAQENWSPITIFYALGGAAYYYLKDRKKLDKSIGTLNNNAVTISENGTSIATKALEKVQEISNAVDGYVDKMENLLSEVRANEEEKHKLATTLSTVEKYLETSKAANLELSNEVAELLVLANIPNSKKEELYSRHRAAVDALAEAEKTEVIAGDEQKA